MKKRNPRTIWHKWEYCKVRLWRQELNTINIMSVDTNILYDSGYNSGKSYIECTEFSRCVGTCVNIHVAAVAAGTSQSGTSHTAYLAVYKHSVLTLL